MVGVYIYIVHYVLTIVLDRLNVRNNFWIVTIIIYYYFIIAILHYNLLVL